MIGKIVQAVSSVFRRELESAAGKLSGTAERSQRPPNGGIGVGGSLCQRAVGRGGAEEMTS